MEARPGDAGTSVIGTMLPVLSLVCFCALVLGSCWIWIDRKAERRALMARNAPRDNEAALSNDRNRFSAFELKPGVKYRVVLAFTDFDGRVHPVGETWHYESRNYFPYDAGMCLNVSEAGPMTSIRFQDYKEAQGEIIDRFSDYVSEVPEPDPVAVYPS